MATVTVTKHAATGVAHVELSRPAKGNAMNLEFWTEYRQAFEQLAVDGDVRCIVVSGQGKFFTVGLDIADERVMNLAAGNGRSEPARKAYANRLAIARLQETFTSMERCPQPVIACVQGACIGGGIDLITAADIRLCSKDAYFSVKEVDIGLAADVGTLQRIQHVVGSASVVRDWCYTARKFDSEEAKQTGLVSRVFDSKQAMLDEAFKLAGEIASKSPIAVAGTKQNLNYARGRTVEEGLEYMSIWNASMLQTEDVGKAAMASLKKNATDKPKFSKL